MFLTATEAEKLPFELQKGLLVRQINFTIQSFVLDPVKKTWLERLHLGIKESIARHLLASRSMDPLTKGLKYFAGYAGILPRPEDAQDCARLIESLMEGQNPAKLHLDPACPVLAVVDPRLVGALSGLQANLFSPLLDLRRSAQAQLRMDDLVYTDGQGAIPARYIRMNRDAIRSLVNDVGRSEAMFSLERGGALVADHIKNLMKRGILSYKVPKIDPNHSSAALSDQQRLARRRNPWLIYRQNFDDPEYRRDEHARRFTTAVEQFLAVARDREVTICMVESLVGGASARKILDQAQDILGRYPKVRIRVLLERHTIHQDHPQGQQVERFQPHKGTGSFQLFQGRAESLALTLSSIPAPYQRTGPSDRRPVYDPKALRADVTLAQARYIIGEDVNYQLTYEGPDVSRPVVIFDESPHGVVRAIQLVPRGPMTARDILQRLIEGAYDHILASYGIQIE